MKPPPQTITARYCHTCAKCGRIVFPGDTCYVSPAKQVFHAECAPHAPHPIR